MTEFIATIYTANLREVEGCDSDEAVNAIVAAVEKAAAQYALHNDVLVRVTEHPIPHERNMSTVTVGYDDTNEEYWIVNETVEELTEALDYAIDKAIEDGDW